MKEVLHKKLTEMNEWYNRTDVKYQLIRFTKNREFAALVPKDFAKTKVTSGNESVNMEKKSTRYFRCHSKQHFEYIYNNILYDQNNIIIYNFYTSMAEYKNGLPKFPPQLRFRETKDWMENHWKEMSAYDLLIDVDMGNNNQFSYAKEIVLNLITHFTNEKVPFKLRYSGMGFHVIIPYEFFKELPLTFNPNAKNSIFMFYSKITKKLNELYGDLIDWNVTDSRRISKLPYTLSIYGDCTMVCLPINSFEEFIYFKPEHAKYSEWKNRSVTGRGEVLLNTNHEKICCKRFLRSLKLDKEVEL